MRHKSIRTRKGAAIIGLVIALFFFILLAGIFAFDASRAQMAQREIIATCDSAALAGTAMLASADISNDVNPPPPDPSSKLYIAQQNSAAYARNMFQAGNILGHPLGAAANVTAISDLTPAGPVPTNACNMLVGLANPENNFQSVDAGDVNGKAVMVFAAFGYHPVFLSVIGVQNMWLRGQSTGGLPQVDSVMVFDYSGSMDDNTRVTMVRRYWDRRATPPSGSPDGMTDATNPVGPSNGCIRYKPIVPWSTACELTEYIKFDFTNFPTGTHLNVLPPQNLQATQAGSTLASSALINFDTLLRCPVGRRDVGTPPGNCTISSTIGTHPNPACTSTSNADGNWSSGTGKGGCGTFYCGGPTYTIQMVYDDSYTGGTGYKTNNVYMTDMIVNIANPGTWPYTQPLNGFSPFDAGGNYTWNGGSPVVVTFDGNEPDTNLQGGTFTFPSLPFTVEAARGNLDQANRRSAAFLTRGVLCDLDPSCTAPVSYTSANMTPTTGPTAHYQRAYQRLAMLYSQPIATATDGADGGFFQKVNTMCDARFGFVGFSDAFFGTPPTAYYETQGSPQGTASDDNSAYISSNFCGAPYNLSQVVWNGVLTCTSGTALPNGVGVTTANRPLSSPEGGAGFRIPRVRLANGPASPEDQATLYQRCVSSPLGFGGGVSAPWSGVTGAADGLYNGRPMTNTDCYEAMNTAYTSFTTYDPENYRIAARRAIVFFTDGEPTGGLSSAEAGSTTGLAPTIRGAGIAVYTIGLNLTGNAQLTSDQVSFLGNNTGGLAKECGNGGRFFSCTSADAVKKAFAAVARRLTQAQR